MPARIRVHVNVTQLNTAWAKVRVNKLIVGEKVNFQFQFLILTFKFDF